MYTYRKSCSLLLLTLVIAGCSSAFAGHGFKQHSGGEYFTDTAKVVSAVPVYRTVRVAEPVEQCYEEEIGYRADDDYKSATPMIAGGVLGAVVGNQFGRGDGKTFMTIAGTLLGGSIGRDIGARHRQQANYVPYTETRCETITEYHEEERLDGYRVTYRYHGQIFHTTLPYDPGKRLKVDVSIRPYK